jgi:hypothetical protein
MRKSTTSDTIALGDAKRIRAEGAPGFARLIETDADIEMRPNGSG